MIEAPYSKPMQQTGGIAAFRDTASLQVNAVVRRLKCDQEDGI
jgi:hypothetical protein